MFVLRSFFWLTTVVMLLPPSQDGREPAPRVNLIHTAYAARALFQDLSGVCERNRDACDVSAQALTLFVRKVETGAGIVSAGISASQRQVDPNTDHGTLTSTDLEPEWSLADAEAAK